MQTEELYLPKKPQADQVLSPALVSASSHCCLVTNEKGREVPLTLAGYNLSFGVSYQIRVSGPVKELRLAGYPNHFIRIQSENASTIKHEQQFRYIPIRVASLGFWDRVTHHGIYPHVLESEVTFLDDRKAIIIVPIVLQMSFVARVGWIVVGALLFAVPGIVKEVLFGWNVESLLSFQTWCMSLLFAVLYAGWVVLLGFWSLRNRAKELQEEFDSRWRAYGTGTAKQS